MTDTSSLETMVQSWEPPPSLQAHHLVEPFRNVYTIGVKAGLKQTLCARIMGNGIYDLSYTHHDDDTWSYKSEGRLKGSPLILFGNPFAGSLRLFLLENVTETAILDGLNLLQYLLRNHKIPPERQEKKEYAISLQAPPYTFSYDGASFSLRPQSPEAQIVEEIRGKLHVFF